MARTRRRCCRTARGWAGRARRSNGSRRRAISSSLKAYQDRLLALTRTVPDFISPRHAAQRDRQLRQRRAGGPLDQPHHLRLGLAGAGRSQACDVCLGRCAQQLPHRHRLSRSGRSARALLAGRRPHHRQGHRPLPRGLLAGLPDVGRLALPKRVFGHGFLLNKGEKMSKSLGNVVDPFGLARCLWRRSAALFLPARGLLRPGRQLQPRRDRRAHQRRSRQRSRQSGAALAVDDRQELRGQGAARAAR